MKKINFPLISLFVLAAFLGCNSDEKEFLNETLPSELTQESQSEEMASTNDENGNDDSANVPLDGESVYGLGIDPKLNITEYVFPAEGGELILFGEEKTPLLFFPKYIDDEPSMTAVEGTKGNIYTQAWDGGWFSIKTFIEPKMKFSYIFKVDKNDTGEDRKLNFYVDSYNYGCHVNFS